jgi:hypothetical protein
MHITLQVSFLASPRWEENSTGELIITAYEQALLNFAYEQALLNFAYEQALNNMYWQHKRQ